MPRRDDLLAIVASLFSLLRNATTPYRHVGAANISRESSMNTQPERMGSVACELSARDWLRVGVVNAIATPMTRQTYQNGGISSELVVELAAVVRFLYFDIEAFV